MNNWSCIVTKADGEKCPRCKKHTISYNYEDLCDRCVIVLIQNYPNHESVQFILNNLEERGIKVI